RPGVLTSSRVTRFGSARRTGHCLELGACCVRPRREALVRQKPLFRIAVTTSWPILLSTSKRKRDEPYRSGDLVYRGCWCRPARLACIGSSTRFDTSEHV